MISFATFEVSDTGDEVDELPVLRWDMVAELQEVGGVVELAGDLIPHYEVWGSGTAVTELVRFVYEGPITLRYLSQDITCQAGELCEAIGASCTLEAEVLAYYTGPSRLPEGP